MTAGASWRDTRGQATILVLGLALAVLLGALALGAIAHGVGSQGDQQRAADLAALAGARAMHDAYAGLFEAPVVAGRANQAHLERAAYLALGRRVAVATARRNGATRVVVGFPDAAMFAPVRVRVEIRDDIVVGESERVPAGARAEAELAPPAEIASTIAGAGEYRGPLAYRQGKPMRPDVAAAFDRMAAAASRDGVGLVVVSGFRTNAEQAVLFARHPDPKWVAAPGQSLHRLGTELDLGPPAASGWLAANAPRFHFVQRYSCKFASSGEGASESGMKPGAWGFSLCGMNVGTGGGSGFPPAVRICAQRPSTEWLANRPGWSSRTG